MKPLVVGLTLLLSAGQANAEYRTVLIQVKQDKDRKTVVTISSDEAKERKSGISPDEAAKVIAGMRGWGSAVGVYVVSERDVARGDQKKLLAAISDNFWLDLVSSGREVPKHVRDHFLKPADGK
jgi:hypothetical protein